MLIASRSRPRALGALGTIISLGLVAACTLPLEGLPSGMGGASSSAASTSVASTGGTGGVMLCSPGETRPCYGGKVGTMDVGLCKAGLQTCNTQGSSWGMCVGEVLPEPKEDCSTTTDENCDGQVNEMCPCMAGSTGFCYNGPMGTENVGPCKQGTHTCNQDGMGYGPCMGEVVPMPEDCATNVDEDCNGEIFNDTAAGCVCDPASAPIACTVAGQVGPCADSTQKCLSDGKGYDPCAQTVFPTFDDCFTAADDDCNGVTAGCLGTTIFSSGGGVAGEDQVFAVAVDSMGNIVSGGIGGGTGSGFYPTKGTGFLSKVDPNGVQATGWPLIFNAGAANLVVVRGVATDTAGNVILVGEYTATFNVAGGALLSYGGMTDGFIAKVSSAGTHLWSRGFGDGQAQRAYAVSLDTAGNVYVTGEMGGGSDFGGGTIVAKGKADVFVVKLDPNGGQIWAKRFGDSGENQYGFGIATVPGGDVVVAGEMRGGMDFPGGALTSAGGSDVFVARLKGADGSLVWSKNFGDNADQAAAAVAVDPSGNVGITGVFKSSITFGANTKLMANGGANDLFVARLGSDGTPTWSQGFGDTKEQFGQAVAMDGAGNLVVAGHFGGNLTIGATVLMNSDINKLDVFVAKFQGATGVLGWARRFGDTSDQVAWAVATDAASNAVVAGGFQGTIDFGLPSMPLTSMGGFDGYGVKLAP